MQKLLLSLAVATLFGCSNTPEGHYIDGIYIPTHITQCVDFCEPRGKVFSMTYPGESTEVTECKCGDGTIQQIPYEPHISPTQVQTQKSERSALSGAWVVFKYAFWGQGSREDLPWWE